MSTLWKRKTALHPDLNALHRCLQADWFLLPYELQLQTAHATVLLEAEVLDSAEHDAIQQALHAIGEAQSGNTLAPDSECEDLHTWVEFELVRRVGAAGKKIHTARSRNDQVATLLVLYLLDEAAQLSRKALDVGAVLCRQATTWSDAEFPLHTHTQFAAPGSVGAWFLRFATALERKARQLESSVAAWKRSCPLGSGAVAGSSIPIDRQRHSELLGFTAPSWSALDSTTSRDECVEFLATLAQTALHLQSFATDCILFTHPALAWLVYPQEFATGSSMMPNKSNPDALELLRGECCALQAAHTHALLVLKGLPSGYNRDLQCIKPIVHDAAVRMRQLLRLVEAFVNEIEFDVQQLERALRIAPIGATLAMEDLVRSGVAMRSAHHAIADSIASDSFDATAPSANAYRTFGAASPDEVRNVAAALRERLKPGPA